MQRVYGPVWRFVAGYFRVPERAPSLTAHGGGTIESFRPAEGFLRYLKFVFWIVLVLIDGGLLALWMLSITINPKLGLALGPLFLVVAVVPDVVAYVALQLRYDTTWYVLSDRSLRLRRGIWIIRETTITFENVQNIAIKQGPLQRRYGIANLVVETAGGGGGESEGDSGAHTGLIEGIADAQRIRDLILARVRRSRSAGLGDEGELAGGGGAPWTASHVEALRGILAEVVALRREGTAG